jgi:leucyl aminopeptidase (aminopeptidase T)
MVNVLIRFLAFLAQLRNGGIPVKKSRWITFLSFCTAIGCAVLCGTAALAQEMNFADLAGKIIKTSANVKPGDVVVIAGGKHDMTLMEALAIEARKQGGIVQMFFDSDKYERAVFTEVPDKYLDQQPTYLVEWVKTTNVFIGLPGVEDSKSVFGDVPQDKLAKSNKAGQVITDSLNSSGVRAVYVGYPTASDAAVNQLDFATYQKVFWDALGADLQKISQDGNKLKQMLQGAKTVRVTSPSGTDFTFSVGNRPIFVDDGIMTDERARSKDFQTRAVSLPGGTVFVAPIETSASGKVVVPRDQCMFKPLTGESFSFNQGRIENYKAESGAQCYADAMAPFDGPKDVFGFFQIGLNPGARVIENPGDYRPLNAAGLVYIAVGDNALQGGDNKVKGGGGFGFAIVNATVTIDGKTAVKDGKLTF